MSAAEDGRHSRSNLRPLFCFNRLFGRRSRKSFQDIFVFQLDLYFAVDIEECDETSHTDPLVASRRKSQSFPLEGLNALAPSYPSLSQSQTPEIGGAPVALAQGTIAPFETVIGNTMPLLSGLEAVWIS